METPGDEFSALLFLPHVYNYLIGHRDKEMQEDFPLGLPMSALDDCLLEDAVDWLADRILDIPRPFLGYFHFLPPHAPYNTRREFMNAFRGDGLANPDKPSHPLAKINRRRLQYGIETFRRAYDEFVLYVDSEFNRLFSALDHAGVLDNTYLIFTSDHGEMFERGILGHTTPSLHAPIVRTPLLIFEPGQPERKDVIANTSAVDILPTILRLAGKSTPSWLEGVPLIPGLPAERDRSIYALEAKTNHPLEPLTSASAMIVKENWKLTSYFGSRDLGSTGSLIELFDIANDPEELDELSTSQPSLAAGLLEELNRRITAADQQFDLR
jgi:arylsulfatase A-like enzyme